MLIRNINVLFKPPVCCQMIQQADPGPVQYGSVIPQLATHMSALQIGNGSVSLFSNDISLLLDSWQTQTLLKIECYTSFFFVSRYVQNNVVLL